MYQCRLGSPTPWQSLTQIRSTYVFGTLFAQSPIFPMYRPRLRDGCCSQTDSTGSGIACFSTTESNSETWTIDTSNRRCDPLGALPAPTLDAAETRRAGSASSFPRSDGSSRNVVSFRRTFGNSNGRLSHRCGRGMDEVRPYGGSWWSFRGRPSMRGIAGSHSRQPRSTLSGRPEWFQFRTEHHDQQHGICQCCERDIEAR